MNEHDEYAPPVSGEGAMETPGDEAMDAMVAGARIQRGVVMDDQRILTDDQRANIRAKYLNLLESGAATYAATSKAIGGNVTKSLLSLVIRDKYRDKGRGKNTVDRVLRDVDRWMAAQEARGIAPKLPGFVWTKLALEFRAVVNAAVEMGTCAAIWGESGIGKSITAQAVAESTPGSVYLAISDGSDTPASFLRDLARRLRLEASRERYENRGAIVRSLSGTGRLLVVDDAHFCNTALLRCLVQLHDECRIPIAFVGQPTLARNLLRGRGDDSIGAMIYSRVQVRLDLQERTRGDRGEPLYTAEEVRKVFAASAIRVVPSAVRWLASLANQVDIGGLRAAVYTALLAAYIVAKSNDPASGVTEESLENAMRYRLGLEHAEAINERVREGRKVG